MSVNVNVNDEKIINNNESLTTLNERALKEKKIVYSHFKRLIDIVGSLIGIVLLLPTATIVFIARFILKEDDGPMMYEQLRVGKDGKYFRIYKFRTMVVGADKILNEYLENNEEAKKEFEANHKLKNDPRITKIGNILRKTSIDELPQFINVLKGDMSLVGPRPLVDGEIELHNGNPDLYESVKPGITGYWACNGRSELTYEERLKLEYYYIENMSLILDIKCVLKTISAVVSRKGAK